MSKYIFSLLLFLCTQSTLLSQQTIEWGNQKSIEIGNDLIAFFEDSTHTYTFSQVSTDQHLFSPYTKPIPNFGNNLATIWGKIILKNIPQEGLYLELENPLLDSLDFYTLNVEGEYEKITLGARQNFYFRPVQVNNFVIPISYQGYKSQEYFFRVRSEYPIQMPIRLYSKSSYVEKQHLYDVIYGIYFGFLIVMALYNVFLFVFTRSITYFFYILYITNLLVLYALFKGYSFEFLWPNTPQINFYLPSIVSSVIIFGMLFSASFLDTKKHFRKIHIGIYAIIALNMGVIVLNLSGNYSISAPVSQFLSLIMAIYLLFAATYSLLKGVKIARFFLLAWTLFLLGIIVLILQINTVIPSNFFTQNAPYFGSAIEVVLLSVALADRINTYKRKHQEAQDEVLKKTLENEKLIKEQNVILKNKVEEATRELQGSNEELRITLETVQEQKKTIQERSDEVEAVNEELQSTNEELNTTIETVKQQSKVIADKNRHITSSLRYAQTIQEATLPFEERMQKFLKSYFTLYKPKDIVSGDFYWITELNDKVYLAVADCTGHGVPGAFMSMIGSSALDTLVDRNELESPTQILSELHTIIQKALKQKNNTNADGMDIGLCVLEYLPDGKCKIEFAGAKRPFYYFKHQTNELMEIKGDRQSIGGYSRRERKPFSVNEITLEPQDCFYLFTDGYIDQNNNKGKSLGSRHFKKMISQIAPLSLSEQKKILERGFDEHKGHELQRDDVAIVGVRIEA